MWPWWVKIPTEDFTDVTLAIDGTYGDDVGGGVGSPFLKQIWIQMGIAQITIWPPSLRSNGHFVALFYPIWEILSNHCFNCKKKCHNSSWQALTVSDGSWRFACDHVYCSQSQLVHCLLREVRLSSAPSNSNCVMAPWARGPLKVTSLGKTANAISDTALMLLSRNARFLVKLL